MSLQEIEHASSLAGVAPHEYHGYAQRSAFGQLDHNAWTQLASIDDNAPVSEVRNAAAPAAVAAVATVAMATATSSPSPPLPPLPPSPWQPPPPARCKAYVAAVPPPSDRASHAVRCRTG